VKEVIMNAELVLKLGKKIVFQLLVLGMILLIVLIATGVPTNFNVYYDTR